MTNYIFITGGVISGIGKGISTASIAAILEGYGFNKITIKKLDPYLNVDAGTMNPFQHGEVFVTEDGLECDLDLGHYERFTNCKMTKNNNITSGQIFKNIIEKERKGDYLGKTVQFIPDVSNEIKKFIKLDSDKYDFVLCEIGGSVGDYEAGIFYESIRQMKNETDNCCFIHVSWIPFLKASSEFKTKPTQNTCKQLMFHGIQPDFLICRSDHSSKSVFKKISMNTNVKFSNIIDAPNIQSVYRVPLLYSKQKLGKNILKHFDMDIPALNLEKWKFKLEFDKTIRIGICGKYIGMTDTYKSLVEALHHSCIGVNVNCEIIWINCREEIDFSVLDSCNCIIVPGGFGVDGTENKISIIQYCREENVPLLGICLGCQLIVIEYFRNVLKWTNATSREFSETGLFIVDILDESVSELGGTQRLGNYNIELLDNSIASKIYNKNKIVERHRHRYEINPKYTHLLKDLNITGLCKDIPEIVESPRHKFFFGCQYHPEYQSRLFKTHPIFDNLIKSCL